MATLEDVGRIARTLPETTIEDDRCGVSVANRGKAKALCWAWKERVAPKGPRVPRSDVLAIRVAGEEAKRFLVSAVPSVSFTEPHYDGFPAVLVRLAAIEPEQLEELLIDAWRIQAPKSLVRAYDARAMGAPG